MRLIIAYEESKISKIIKKKELRELIKPALKHIKRPIDLLGLYISLDKKNWGCFEPLSLEYLFAYVKDCEEDILPSIRLYFTENIIDEIIFYMFTHEICHLNQFLDKRLVLSKYRGSKKKRDFLEKEAKFFADGVFEEEYGFPFCIALNFL